MKIILLQQLKNKNMAIQIAVDHDAMRIAFGFGWKLLAIGVGSVMVMAGMDSELLAILNSFM